MDSIGAPRYELGRCLGTGATGVVYEAFDRDRQLVVALKTLRRLEPTALRRLKHEFRALADLTHPNLVRLHELVARDEGAYVTMDLVDGVPFLDWVRGGAPHRTLAAEPTYPDVWGADDGPGPPDGPVYRGQPPRDVWRLREAFRQLAEGVHALHQHGQLHRDLKPSNVLVEDDAPAPRVVLLDFGLVSTTGGPAPSGPVVGTVAYMSPEQGAGQALTPASDWYAVGTMLFEALTGERPFDGSLNHILAERQIRPAPDPNDRCPGLPQDLARLCKAMVNPVPEERPAGAEIVRAFGGSVDPLPSGSGLGSGLVGRDAELAALEAGWIRARNGRPVLATIRGRSGIGKTALVERFVAAQSAMVLSSRCYERESVPFKALDGLVDALAERLGPAVPPGATADDLVALSELFPVFRRRSAPSSPTRAAVDPRERRDQAFQALVHLLAACGPLIVVVDDAQWGDADSVPFFAELLRARLPILVVLTWRAEEESGSPFLAGVLRHPLAQGDWVGVHLDVLPPDDSRALARRLRPEATEDSVDAIAEASGGHPLFVQELARATPALRPELGPSLDDAIRARVATLPDEVRAALETVAVAGGPVEERLLGQALGQPDPRAPLAVLRSHRFARTSGSRVEPYHDRVREAVVDGLAPDRLAAIHRSLASALLALGSDDPEPIGRHLAQAGEAAAALPYLVRAAERATAALAFDHAEALYRLARALGPVGPGASRDLAVAHGYALAAAGRPEEAAATWLAIADCPVELACLAASHLLAAGHLDRGRGILERLAADAGVTLRAIETGRLVELVLRNFVTHLRGVRFVPRAEPVPTAVRERLAVLWAAVDGLVLIDPLRSAAYRARFLPEALRSGDPAAAARALITESGGVAFVGGSGAWDRAQRLLDEASRAVAAARDPELAGLHRFGGAMLAYHQHRFDEAAQQAAECERHYLAHCAHAAPQVARTRMLQAWCHLWRGRLQAIGELVPKMVKDAEERGNLYLATSALTDVGYVLGMVRDDPDTFWQALDDREARGPADGFHLQHLNIGLSRVQLAAYRGDPETAWVLADRLHASWSRSVFARSLMFRLLVPQLRARAALALAEGHPDRRPELLRVVRRHVRDLVALDRPHGLATSAGLEARLLELEGDPDRAVARMREAITGLDAIGIAAMAQAYRRHLGLMIGGDEGAAQVASAEGWLRDQGVLRPGRFASGMLMTDRGR